MLLCPVASVPAWRHGEREWVIDGQTVEYLDAVRYTQWFNALGAPAAVVPVGLSPEGLPIGVQVAARPFEDEVALGVAACGGSGVWISGTGYVPVTDVQPIGCVYPLYSRLFRQVCCFHRVAGRGGIQIILSIEDRHRFLCTKKLCARFTRFEPFGPALWSSSFKRIRFRAALPALCGTLRDERRGKTLLDADRGVTY